MSELHVDDVAAPWVPGENVPEGRPWSRLWAALEAAGGEFEKRPAKWLLRIEGYHYLLVMHPRQPGSLFIFRLASDGSLGSHVRYTAEQASLAVGLMDHGKKWEVLGNP